MSQSKSDTGGNPSRRRFIRKAALGAGAALTLPRYTWGGPFGPPGDSERKLGIALVGLGNYSTGQLGPALQETEKCYLAGIVTGTLAKEQIWKDRYGIPESNIYNYENYDAIAENPQIDIIYVVLPPSMHAEYTIRAARAGKHVICEKPMAVSVRECEEMIAACRDAGRKLSIGYRLHFEPHNLEMMRIGREEVFGPVKAIEAGFGYVMRNPELPHNVWRLSKEMGGGALPDLGIYAVQAARYITGEEPVAVTAQEYETKPEMFGEVDETIFWQMEFPSGAVASCSTSFNAGFNRLYMAADRGWAELRPSFSYRGIQGRTHEQTLGLPSVNQQALQMDDFADCVLNDRESRVPGEMGLRDIRVIEAIYMAAETGRRVEV